MIERDKLNLIQYIKTEQAKGVPKTQIEQALISQGGWNRDDLFQVFGSIDVVSPSAISKGTITAEKSKLVSGKHKLWYLLLLLSTFLGVSMSKVYVSFSYFLLGDNEKMAILGFVILELLILLFNIFIVRGIARNSTRHDGWRALGKILLFLMLNIGLWAMVAILNNPGGSHSSPRDLNPINESYINSSLPNVVTTTGRDFTLLQGQAANLTDIGATVRYTGYNDYGNGGRWIDYTFTYDDQLKGDPKETYDVLFPVLNYDTTYVDVRVETPVATCEREYNSSCWLSLSSRKNDPAYCLKITAPSRTRSNCISYLVVGAYWGNKDVPGDAVKAREICKMDDNASSLNMCTAIGKEKPLTQNECLAYTKDAQVVLNNGDFYQLCFLVAAKTYPDLWDPSLCASIQSTAQPFAYSSIRRSCESTDPQKYL